MTKISFTSLIFLLISLSLPTKVFSYDDDEQVTCGSAIKITNADGSDHYLNSSEGTSMRGGSGQQLVTWEKESPGDSDKLWLVRPRHKITSGDGKTTEYSPDPANVSKKGTNSCTYPGEPIRCNSIIRLTHLSSQRNLHSHTVSSPLSHQQEVSAYGAGDGIGDASDNWFIRCKTKYWQRNEKVKLQHAETQSYLGSSAKSKFHQNNCGRGCPIMNHLESFARKYSDSLSDIKAKSGVHLYM